MHQHEKSLHRVLRALARQGMSRGDALCFVAWECARLAEADPQGAPEFIRAVVTAVRAAIRRAKR